VPPVAARGDQMGDRLTDEQLAGIRARLAAATKGPWRKCTAHEGKCSCGFVWSGDDGIVVLRAPRTIDRDTVHCAPPDQQARNQDFAAHSWQDVADLLAEVERLTMLADGRQEMFRRLADQYAEEKSTTARLRTDLAWEKSLRGIDLAQLGDALSTVTRLRAEAEAARAKALEEAAVALSNWPHIAGMLRALAAPPAGEQGGAT